MKLDIQDAVIKRDKLRQCLHKGQANCAQQISLDPFGGRRSMEATAAMIFGPVSW